MATGTTTPLTPLSTILRGKRVYLDANIFIYFLEGTGSAADAAADILEAAGRGEFAAVTGDLAVAEVMVGPYRLGDPMLIRSVRAFFRQPRLLEIVGLSAQALDDAAMLRGTLDIRLIDAAHLATAAEAGCSAILTNDARMPSALGVEVLALSAPRG